MQTYRSRTFQLSEGIFKLYNTIQPITVRYNKSKSCTRARFATFLVIVQ